MGDELDDLLGPGPGSTGHGGAALEVATYGPVRHPSAVTRGPLVVASAAIAASVAILVLAPEPAVPQGPLDWVLPVAGYVLSPLAPMAALVRAWVRGLAAAEHPRFDQRGFDRRFRLLQVAAVASFAVALPHLQVLAQYATLRGGPG